MASNIQDHAPDQRYFLGTSQVGVELNDLVMDYRHEEATDPLSSCRGCKYLYGKFDAGRLLVCFMHPNGMREAGCLDRESH